MPNLLYPMTRSILRVVIDIPIRKLFDYLPLTNAAQIIGARVQVPFGNAKKIGVIIDVVQQASVDQGRLKYIDKVIDEEAILPQGLLDLLHWSSEYYMHPLGEVVIGALPALLRKGENAHLKTIQYFQVADSKADLDALKRSPKQARLLSFLSEHHHGATADQLNQKWDNWRTPMAKLIEKSLVKVKEQIDFPPSSQSHASQRIPGPHLNSEQVSVVKSIKQKLNFFSTFLLEGVTGSGKTEVYLRIIQEILEKDLQVLVLVPEIALTPQLIRRFQQRFDVSLVAMHSGLSDRERLNAWLLAKEGKVSIVIGTRSAVFTPFRQLGLIVVDEEHDASLKQQDGFRYSARDIAVRRAQMLNIPIILGSATPSLESLHNAISGKYHHLELPERAGGAIHPQIKVLDVRSKAIHDGLSNALLDVIRQRLTDGQQVMLFLNRRGYAPTLLCHDCGWVSECNRCDSRMTLHSVRNRLRCHHCGAERAIDKQCPQCNSEDLIPIGLGTERIEQAVAQRFPDFDVIRIDRDTIRRKGALEKKLEEINSGKACILLGTQMLAKGHHFSNVTLVGIIDIDQGLFSTDFRATERMAQLITQVAGRAGREEKPGEVLIQTHHPEHPLLQTLIKNGYNAFAKIALAERQAANLPPYSYMALLRAEAVDAQQPYVFLNEAKQLANQVNVADVQLSGPVAAPMEKRAGRFRAQLLLQSNARAKLHGLLAPWVTQLEQLKSGRKVRWSLDVDPVELY